MDLAGFMVMLIEMIVCVSKYICLEKPNMFAPENKPECQEAPI